MRFFGARLWVFVSVLYLPKALAWPSNVTSVRAGKTTKISYGNSAASLCRKMLESGAPNVNLNLSVGVGAYVDSFSHVTDHRIGDYSSWVTHQQSFAHRQSGLDSEIVATSGDVIGDIKKVSEESLRALSRVYGDIYPARLVETILKEEEAQLSQTNTAFLALSLPSQSTQPDSRYVSFLRHYDFGPKAIVGPTNSARALGYRYSPAPVQVALRLRGIESKTIGQYERRRSIVELAKDEWHLPWGTEPKRVEVKDPHDVAWDPPVIPRGVKIREVGRAFIDPALKKTPEGMKQYKEARRLQDLWQESAIENDAYYIGHCSLASNEGFDLTLSWGFGVLEKINVNKDPNTPPQWEYIMMVKGSDFRKALEEKRRAYEGVK